MEAGFSLWEVYFIEALAAIVAFAIGISCR
jgi:hypothetical protein